MCLSLNLFSQYRSTSDVLPTQPSPSNTTLNEYVFPPAAAMPKLSPRRENKALFEPLADHSSHRDPQMTATQTNSHQSTLRMKSWTLLNTDSLLMKLCHQPNGVPLSDVTEWWSGDHRASALFPMRHMHVLFLQGARGGPERRFTHWFIPKDILFIYCRYLCIIILNVI